MVLSQPSGNRSEAHSLPERHHVELRVRWADQLNRLVPGSREIGSTDATHEASSLGARLQRHCPMFAIQPLYYVEHGISTRSNWRWWHCKPIVRASMHHRRARKINWLQHNVALDSSRLLREHKSECSVDSRISPLNGQFFHCQWAVGIGEDERLAVGLLREAYQLTTIWSWNGRDPVGDRAGIPSINVPVAGGQTCKKIRSKKNCLDRSIFKPIICQKSWIKFKCQIGSINSQYIYNCQQNKLIVPSSKRFSIRSQRRKQKSEIIASSTWWDSL